jgi:hypothetical protein
MQALGGRNLLRVKDRSEDDLIGEREALHQLGLEDVAAKSIRARLENRPETPSGIRGAQRAQSFANRRRVVREVVDDGDTVDLSANLETATDTAKSGERLDNGVLRDALAGCQRRCRRGVERVMFARNGKSQLSPRVAGLQECPVADAVFETQIGEAPDGIFPEAVALDGTKRATGTLRDVVRPSKATIRPRRGTRFTRRWNAVLTASRSA